MVGYGSNAMQRLYDEGVVGRRMHAKKQFTGTRKYPFISFVDLDRYGIKLPMHYFLYKICSAIPVKPTEERDTLSSLLVGGLVDLGKTAFGQLSNIESRAVFPKILIWYDYAKHSSKVDEIYTVEWQPPNPASPKRELPIYLKTSGGPDPSNLMLENAINYIINSPNVRGFRGRIHSPFENSQLIGRYRDERFHEVALDKITRGDFKKFVEPGRFDHYPVRDDTWRVQQKGRIWNGANWVYTAGTVTMTLPVGGTNYTIRRYKRPGCLSMWWYWFVFDKIYDFVDMFFDPIQEMSYKYLTKQSQQEFVRNEYKMIAGIARSCFDNKSRLDLAYDLKN